MDQAMIGSQPTTGEHDAGADDATPERPDNPEQALTTLRGAAVVVDFRHLGRVAVGLCLVALGVLAVALFVAGAHKNAQLTDLHQHGVPVEVTVTGCTGLLGGSGSNAAGYQCRGSFTLAGHRDNEALPGNTLYPPGTTLRALTVPGDPALVTTANQATAEHPSASVFILPTVLLVLLMLALGALALRTHRARRRATEAIT
jgi:hypothetical protein